jgi:hypothetical protein
MSGLKYIRFRDLLEPNPDKSSELLNTVLSSLAPSDKPLKTTAPPPSQGDSPSVSFTDHNLRPFNQWTSSGKDIAAWFAHHHLSNQLRDLFDFQSGEEMLDYAQLLMKDRENQMQIYANIYAEKYHSSQLPPHEFIRFAKALEQLVKDQQLSSSPGKSDVPIPPGSIICTVS